MLKGPGRSGTEQNHIEAEFAMKGTHPPQAGLSFHGFFKIVGPAGDLGSYCRFLGFWSRLLSLCRRFLGFWSRSLRLQPQDWA